MLYGAGKAVKAGNHDDGQLPGPGVGHESVQLRPTVLGAADTLIPVLDNVKASTFGVFPQCDSLSVCCLSVTLGGNPHIKRTDGSTAHCGRVVDGFDGWKFRRVFGRLVVS